MELSKWHWIVPGIVFLAALVWLALVRSDNKDILQLTQNQNIDEHLEYIDVINLKRREEKMPELDEDEFRRIYYQKLAVIESKYPISAYFARKKRMRDEQNLKKKE